MTILKYPEDLTGNNPNNLILKESHDISAISKKVIVPEYGAFYSKSLKVYNGTSLIPLTPKVDYVAFQLHPEASENSSQECFTLILMQGDAALIPIIKIDYQAVGGNYYLSSNAIQNYFDILAADNRPIYWGDMIGQPDAYPPASHPHNAMHDLIGLSSLVVAIQDLIVAITSGNDAELTGIYAYIDQVMSGGSQNYASLAEALAGISSTKVISPSTLAGYVTQLVTTPNNTKFNNVYNYLRSDFKNIINDLFGSTGLFLDNAFKPTIVGSSVNLNTGILYVKGKRFSLDIAGSTGLPSTYPSELWVKVIEPNTFVNNTLSCQYEYRAGTSTIDYEYAIDNIDNITTYHYAKVALVTTSTTLLDKRNTFNNKYGLLYQNKDSRISITTSNYPTLSGNDYLLLNGGSALLPDTTNLPIGSWVTFEKDVGLSPTITVKNTSTETFKVETAKGVLVTDTVLTYDDVGKLVFIFTGNNWVLIYG